MSKKRTIHRRPNYTPGRFNEKTVGASKTIPGETYTIRELLNKHTRGILPPGIDREPIYDNEPNFDSPDFQKINRSDINDKKQFQRETKEQQSELSNTIKKQQQHHKEKKSNKQENTQKTNNADEAATTEEDATISN